jgi:hypothetical protein
VHEEHSHARARAHTHHNTSTPQAPFRQQLDAKRKAAEAQQQLEKLKATQRSLRTGGSLDPHSSPPPVAKPAAAGAGGRLSRREKLFQAQAFVCPDVDGDGFGLGAEEEREGSGVEVGEKERATEGERRTDAMRERALGVARGGSMADVMEVPADDEAGLKRRAAQRRVWDKKRMRFVNAEHVRGSQGRELRVRNEAGMRFAPRRTPRGQDGELYTKWKKDNNIRIQRPGQTENLKNQKKASGKALVNLRNSRAGPAAARASGGGFGGGGGGGGASGVGVATRHAAAIVAGPKRVTPALVKIDTAGDVVKAKPGQGAGGQRERERKKRAERQRQRSCVCSLCPPPPPLSPPLPLSSCCLSCKFSAFSLFFFLFPNVHSFLYSRAICVCVCVCVCMCVCMCVCCVCVCVCVCDQAGDEEAKGGDASPSQAAKGDQESYHRVAGEGGGVIQRGVGWGGWEGGEGGGPGGGRREREKQHAPQFL